MYYRPTRLGVIKLLGLWGGNHVNNVNEDENKKNVDINKLNELSLYPKSEKSPLAEGKADLKELNSAIDKSSKKIIGLMLEKGIPGLTICVSVRGSKVWHSAFGFCDVENQLACDPDAHMRIASISKPLFAATVVAPMIEKKKLDIKDSIHKYLTTEEFPKQKFEGKEYDITVEQLLSHTSGIKHYGNEECDRTLKPIGSAGSKKLYQNDEQYNREGFYQRHTFRNVIDALAPFKEGPLANEPGKFSYTTYGYTLLSAVVQKAQQSSGRAEQIEDFWMRTLRRDWKLNDIYLDQDEVIIPKRARYYLRMSYNGGLVNAPYQDASVKWAGGGIVSTSSQLVEFANKLIDSYKGREFAPLKKETVELLWKAVKDYYGFGFGVRPRGKFENSPSENNFDNMAVYHTGAALGASSALIIYPGPEIAVAIITNLGEIDGVFQLGLAIADEFEKLL